MSTKEKFLKYVDKTDTCWLWTGSTLTSGYGQAVRPDASERWKVGKPVQEGAHRVSYKIFIGDIPKGKLVRHSCDNKMCVNPEHLSVGTQVDNMADYGMSEYASKRKRNSLGQFIKDAQKLKEVIDGSAGISSN